MRIRLRDLKMLIETSLALEADDDPMMGPPPEDDSVEKETGDSLDSQVDRYFGQYEGEAKSSKTEGRDFRMLTRRILSEAGEDDDEGGDDAGDAGDGDAMAPVMDEPSKLSANDIDVTSFADSVARLIENYDSLLEVRNTIVRRAKNFLNKSYEEEVVKSFEEVLRNNYGIADGESKMDVEDEDFPAPQADRAGDGGGGPGAPVGAGGA